MGRVGGTVYWRCKKNRGVGKLRKWKIIVLLLLNSLCFGSEFTCYHYDRLDKCVERINTLNKKYKIDSYEIVPAETGGTISGSIKYYNMIVEIEERN